MSEILCDWRYIVRRVRNSPTFFHADGTVSSALFKDSQGVSVDKDHMRSKEEVISDEERLHQFYYSVEEQKNNPGLKLMALVKVNRDICDRNSITVIDDPIPEENLHHCLLFKNQEREKLSQQQAKALSSSFIILKKYS